MKTIVLGVTGSIAAYRAVDLASLLTKAGHSVYPVLTKGGAQFITPMALGTLARNPVTTDIFDEGSSWQPGHIELADKADLLLIAPASANTLAKLAAGISDDSLGAIALATRAPVLIAPALNGKMWEHPATVRNVETLKAWGHQFIGPEDGMLACGYEGTGRLWPVEGIAEAAEEILSEG